MFHILKKSNCSSYQLDKELLVRRPLRTQGSIPDVSQGSIRTFLGYHIQTLRDNPFLSVSFLKQRRGGMQTGALPDNGIASWKSRREMRKPGTWGCSSCDLGLCVCQLGYQSKVPQTGGLNNRHFYLAVLEAGSPKSKCQPIQFLTRTLFLACRRLPCWVVLRLQKEGERERGRQRSLPLLTRALIPS